MAEEMSQEMLRDVDEKELASHQLRIQQKRFYMDVKENQRGRFIKFAEVTSSGQKNRISMPMSASAQFRDKLGDFIDHYSKLGPHNANEVPRDGRLHSDFIVATGNRRYFIDLKENQRGRFLRVAQSARGNRTQIAIPAQGMVEVRDELTKLLEKHGTDDGEVAGITDDLPDPRSMRVDNKVFYFDAGQNARGVFLRISEVRPTFRTAITIPERAWAQFRAIVNMFTETEGGSGAATGTVTAGGDGPPADSAKRQRGAKTGRGRRRRTRSGGAPAKGKPAADENGASGSDNNDDKTEKADAVAKTNETPASEKAAKDQA